ncbi:TRAP transporter large permease subunit [Noviherbaspirillum sp. CPCC 100848]|uniref:TRAP transporter large permease subunit n=1 Tax=Noviherbaspirillum album TaxID=3080276 RepID=A0ABU6JDH5_9BURK|nr:TRAP transporter large permease subunit [Noviherbaspirillum sp. CPCC 100848]MEC4721700.1 TRAP transporter large permease subunit [Noviherbaspirillum sp. CPCC 100848]
MRKEVWFGLSIMGMIVIAIFTLMPAPSDMTNGHLGLLMLALIVLAIMLGFPTAFTLMGMGVMFTWFAYRHVNPDLAVQQTLDLMVQRAYAVMANDVLISVPLFVFMGYLVERANLIDRLFRSLHLAMSRVPGSLAVATIVTCAIFATATGIVGAVVTLMGLLAMPAMLKAGYNVKLAAGSITAGGCLGILIPPSVLLIVYGATAGVSVVKLYAGAFFPGLMLALLYVGYVIVIAKIKPQWAPPLPEQDRTVPLPTYVPAIGRTGRSNAFGGLITALKGRSNAAVPMRVILSQLFVALLPALAFAAVMGFTYQAVTKPTAAETELIEMGSSLNESSYEAGSSDGGLAEPPAEGGLAEPEVEGGLAEPPQEGEAEALSSPPAGDAQTANETAPASPAATQESTTPAQSAEAESVKAPSGFWIAFAIGLAMLAVFYAVLSFARLEIFKMLLGSFFPLALLILAVLGAIVFGLATPTEAAAMGSMGGLLLAAAYRRLNFGVLRESVYLTAKTSAMVCWLFVGSSIFSAAFALLGGQEIINQWVLSMDLTPLQFMILAQVVIFLLGWPLEWTEIIVIFMPIFIPLLPHFNIDPLFFGLLVAMNLQTAFLSPPVAMAAFYLKGVSPPHVTLNQIFLGMLPFMALQVIALIMLYTFPAIGLWLPEVLYK